MLPRARNDRARQWDANRNSACPVQFACQDRGFAPSPLSSCVMAVRARARAGARAEGVGPRPYAGTPERPVRGLDAGGESRYSVGNLQGGDDYMDHDSRGGWGGLAP